MTGIGIGIGIGKRAEAPQVAWVPTGLEDLIGWWRADEVTIVTGVSSWTDLSGNSNDLTQATTTKQPTWAADSGPNSTPAISFDGVDDFLRATFTLAQPYHLFLVVQPTASATSAGNETVCDGAVGNSGRIWTSATDVLTFSTDGSNTLSQSVDEDAWHWLEVLAATTSSSFIADDNAADTGNVGTGSPGGLCLGLFGDQISGPLDCIVAEVILTDAAVTGDDLTALRSYIADRYGLTVTT